MPSLRAIRKRIQIVRNTQQITKAMKMVSGAKFRRAEERLRIYRQGFKIVEELLRDLAYRNEISFLDHPFFQPGDSKGKELFLLISSDRGLCGSFNHNLFREFQDLCESEELSPKELICVTVGKKAYEYVRRRKLSLLAYFHPVNDPPNPYLVARVLDASLPQFLGGEVRQVRIVANHFVNALKQEIKVRLLLPIVLPPALAEGGRVPLLTDPDPRQLFNELLYEYLEGVVMAALLDSLAAEHGARMAAMDAATNNAQEMIRVLTLNYNRARQASITAELLDIINGKNAVEA